MKEEKKKRGVLRETVINYPNPHEGSVALVKSFNELKDNGGIKGVLDGYGQEAKSILEDENIGTDWETVFGPLSSEYATTIGSIGDKRPDDLSLKAGYAIDILQCVYMLQEVFNLEKFIPNDVGATFTWAYKLGAAREALRVQLAAKEREHGRTDSSLKGIEKSRQYEMDLMDKRMKEAAKDKYEWEPGKPLISPSQLKQVYKYLQDTYPEYSKTNKRGKPVNKTKAFDDSAIRIRLRLPRKTHKK